MMPRLVHDAAWTSSGTAAAMDPREIAAEFQRIAKSVLERDIAPGPPQDVDQAPLHPHPHEMAGGPPSREEIDAKLAAVEAHTETRFVALDGKLDRILDHLSRTNAAIDDVRKDSKTTRLTLASLIVASLVAGVAAIWTV
jgi:hypothetical protein